MDQPTASNVSQVSNAWQHDKTQADTQETCLKAIIVAETNAAVSNATSECSAEAQYLVVLPDDMCADLAPLSDLHNISAQSTHGSYQSRPSSNVSSRSVYDTIDDNLPAPILSSQHSESIYDIINDNLPAPILSNRSSNQHQIEDGSDLNDSIDDNFLAAPIIQSSQISNQNHDDRSDLIQSPGNDHLGEFLSDVGHQSRTIVLKRLKGLKTLCRENMARYY